MFAFLPAKHTRIPISKEETKVIPSQVATCILTEGLGLSDGRHLPGRTRPGHETEGTTVSIAVVPSVPLLPPIWTQLCANRVLAEDP